MPSNLPSLYESDGSLRVTVSDGTLSGVYASDGSYRITAVNSPNAPEGSGISISNAMAGNTWIINDGITSMSTATALTANRLYATPISIRRSIDISHIGFETVTAASSAGNIRVGLYSSQEDGRPALRLFGSTEASSTAAAFTDITMGSTLTLEPGLYWGVLLSSTTPVVLNTNVFGYRPVGWSWTTGSRTGQTGLTVATFAYAELPEDISTQSWAATTSVMPIIGLRI